MLILSLLLSIAHVDVDNLTPELLQKVTEQGKIKKKEFALHNTLLSMLNDANDGRKCSDVHFDQSEKEVFLYVRTQLYNFRFSESAKLNDTGYWLHVCWMAEP
jgi:hypothetical protein